MVKEATMNFSNKHRKMLFGHKNALALESSGCGPLNTKKIEQISLKRVKIYLSRARED